MIDTVVRRGPRFWWSTYQTMVRWVLTQQKVLFGAILVTQLFMGVGAAVMYGFFLGEVDETTAVFLVTGIPALSLIPVGFVMVPVLVMQEKFRGTHEFTWSLPVPRMVPAAATFTVFTFISLPIALLSTWLAALRFGVELDPSLVVIPYAVLASLMAASVGYGMALAIPEPRITNLITNIVIFLVLMFSPIAIPIDRFPDWSAVAHRILPFYHMANLIRSGLTDGLATDVGQSLAVVIVWTVVGWALVSKVVAKRD